MTNNTSTDTSAQRIVDTLASRDRIVLAGHARPDGDSLGSQLALAHALGVLGKQVRTVCHDPAPPYLSGLPGIERIEVTSRVATPYDAAVILECGSLDRTEVDGLDKSVIVNIDHHLGNTGYGHVNWVDESAAACGEMVFDVVRALGVPLSEPIAAPLYVAILTDTGSFRHANITARTFDICRHLVDVGISPAEIASRLYQESSIGKLRLTGALLDRMQLVADGRVAVLDVDDALLAATGCAADDMEGLINLPLTARDVQAVVLFKTLDGQPRVSLRSKRAVDVRSVAVAHGGGGHPNAAGLSLPVGDVSARDRVLAEVAGAVEAGLPRAGPADAPDGP